MPSAPGRVSEFDRWVSENVIPDTYQYSKGWWDYVDLVRKLSTKFNVEDVRVVGHHLIDTPPPQERLPMPVVALERRGVHIALRLDFGRMRCWPLEWTVSVRRQAPYLGPTFGLFDANLDLRGERTEGLVPDWLFGSFRENPAQFSCELADEWDVVTLVRLVLHEA